MARNTVSELKNLGHIEKFGDTAQNVPKPTIAVVTINIKWVTSYSDINSDSDN